MRLETSPYAQTMGFTAERDADGRLGVLLGNRDGSFRAETTFVTLNANYAVVPGDFNGDGAVDLVSVDNALGQLSISIGNGDGTFKSKQAYNVGTAPVWAVARFGACRQFMHR